MRCDGVAPAQHQFAQVIAQFVQSQDEFDQWFKRRLAAVTGVDLNNPPPGPLSELLSSYDAAPQQQQARA